MERIRVDFNRRNGAGEIISSVSRATGALNVGDVVVAYQSGEEMDTSAEVVSVDADGKVRLSLLEDNYVSFVPDAVPLWMQNAVFQTPDMVASRVARFEEVRELQGA